MQRITLAKIADNFTFNSKFITGYLSAKKGKNELNRYIYLIRINKQT